MHSIFKQQPAVFGLIFLKFRILVIITFFEFNKNNIPDGRIYYYYYFFIYTVENDYTKSKIEKIVIVVFEDLNGPTKPSIDDSLIIILALEY